jgi:hypothetical protein
MKDRKINWYCPGMVLVEGDKEKGEGGRIDRSILYSCIKIEQ